jgi:endogenous inhibitor of DNA gyrase (YacG/DUF329 family)
VALDVPCPRCGATTVADESQPLPPHFPFCSERCRLVDLGKWFDEEHRISRPARPGEIGPPPVEDDQG